MSRDGRREESERRGGGRRSEMDGEEKEVRLEWGGGNKDR